MKTLNSVLTGAIVGLLVFISFNLKSADQQEEQYEQTTIESTINETTTETISMEQTQESTTEQTYEQSTQEITYTPANTEEYTVNSFQGKDANTGAVLYSITRNSDGLGGILEMYQDAHMQWYYFDAEGYYTNE